MDYVYECLEEANGTKKGIKDILNEAGITDTINFLDNRTKQLLELYEVYSDVSQLDYGIFKDTILILNPINKVRYGW